MLATPILFEKYLLGVLQLINKRGRRRLHAQGRGGGGGAVARSSASPSTTSTARRAATSPPSTALLVDKGLVSEKDIENAVSNARVNQIDVAKVLMEDYKVPKEEIGRALAAVLQLPVLGAWPGARCPPTSRSASPPSS